MVTAVTSHSASTTMGMLLTHKNTFPGLASDIENEYYLKVIFKTKSFNYMEGVIKPIIEPPPAFVAVMCDETIDFRMKPQPSYVLRFVEEKEKPRERYLGYGSDNKDKILITNRTCTLL
ncbi:Hypothetical predicted protein [Octopus vulgaris]|uniref:Uncharacterized protein n=1 Tax=Octopus vulgaris TaxID=6645 RepID=A0AA36BND0_OCTVU|nr:Hypothetical predicted protein [Octopus vulgaris]